MHALGRLIRERMEEKGWSFDDIAERGGLPKGTVHALATRDIKAPPRITTIERLAAGLGLPVAYVSDVAAKTTGYYKEEIPSDDPSVRIIAHVAEQLDPDDRAKLAAMAEALLDAVRKRRSN